MTSASPADPGAGSDAAGAPPQSRVLFDTSVLVTALVEQLPGHDRAAAKLRHAAAGQAEACVAGHGLAELYAILTTLPVRPRIAPGQAYTLIRHNVTSRMRLVGLEPSDYQAVIDLVMRLGMPGGVVYDALHLRAAEKVCADRLVTFNRRDFERFAVETTIDFDFL